MAVLLPPGDYTMNLNCLSCSRIIQGNYASRTKHYSFLALFLQSSQD